MDLKKRETGQVLLIFTFVIVGVLVVVGLALDAGSLFIQRRNAQSAADSAAFAGATSLATSLSLTQTSINTAKAAAMASASTNGFDNNAQTNWVTVNFPPASGPYQGLANYVQVFIRARINTSFIQLVYPGAAEDNTEAVVKFTAISPAGGPNALIGVSPTDCDTVLIHGSINVVVNGGNILSNSNASGSCYSMEIKGASGSGSTTPPSVTVNGGAINVVGSFNSTGNANFSPAPVTGASPLHALYIPPPSCTCGTNISGAACTHPDIALHGNQSQSISPGIYGDISLSNNSSLALSPGLYCISGDFTATGGTVTSLPGGVTIVMLGGALSLNGNSVIANLSAPVSPAPPAPAVHTYYQGTDGLTYDYTGLLVYGDPARYTPDASDTHHTLGIGGTDGNIFTGTIFAPNTNCDLSGNSGTVTVNSQIYCYTVNVGGNGTIDMQFTANLNLQTPPMLELSY
jgi:hypothetical protein